MSAVASSAECTRPPCWRRSQTRLTYKSAPPNSSGVTAMTLVAGADGKASAVVKAKGANLTVGPLPSPLPLRVQLSASDGACWEAWFHDEDVRTNTATKLVATSNGYP